MKKVLCLALALVMVLCCTALAEPETFTLWTTGSQNFGDLFTILTDNFNASQDKYYIEYQHIMSGTGDEGLVDRVVAAYQAGVTDSGFDLLCCSTEDIATYAARCGEDLFVDWDFSKVVGYENITATVSDYKTKLLPYRATMVVFTYDSARIPDDEVPTTWEELYDWCVAHPGRFAYNEPDTGGAGKSFVISNVYRFMDKASWTSSDTAWVDSYTEGLEWLAKLHPYMYQSGGNVLYPTKNQGTLDLLINQEVDIIAAWADQTITNVTAGTLPATTRMMQLSDMPLTGNLDCFAIASIGNQCEGIYDFVAYVISPEGQKICLEEMAAVPAIDASLIESDAKELVNGLSGYSPITIGTLWADELYPLWQEYVLYQ